MPGNGAEIERGKAEGFPLVRIAGQLRIADIERMEKELVAAGGTAEKFVLLDMTSCPYIPSMALPPILGAHQTLAGRGGRLLIAVSRELGEIFRLLKLQGRLNLHPGFEECLKAARALRA